MSLHSASPVKPRDPSDFLGKGEEAGAPNIIELVARFRLEFLARLRDCGPLSHANDASGRRSCFWWFPRRFRGFKTKAVEGAICLPDGSEAESSAAAANRFMKASRADIARLMILRDGAGRETLGDFEYECPHHGYWHVSTQTEARSVLRLAGGIDAFLERLSRYTRRNIRRAERSAAQLGLNFAFRSGPVIAIPSSDAFRLASRNSPLPIAPKVVKAQIELAEVESVRFISHLGRPEENCISLCLGYIRGHAAYLAYQANDTCVPALNLSLLHRSRLIRELTARGITELVFLFGCSGLLRNACEPTLIEERLVIRVSPRAIGTAAIIAACLPRNRYGELSKLILLRVFGRLAHKRLPWPGKKRGKTLPGAAPPLC